MRESKRRRKEDRAKKFGRKQEVEEDVKKNEAAAKREENEEEEEESSDDETSAYQKLMQSLRQDATHKVALEKRRREEEGDDAEGNDDENEDETEDGEGEEDAGDKVYDDEEDVDEIEDEDEDEGGDDGEEEIDEQQLQEADRKELGLDVTCPSSDDESADGDDNDNDADEGDSFSKCFTKSSIDEQEAATVQSVRESTKWRKKDVDGLPSSLLFRPGPQKHPLPASLGADDDLDAALKLCPQIYQQWMSVKEAETNKKQKTKIKHGRKSGEDSDGKGSNRLTPLQRGMLPLVNSYLDVLFTARTTQNADELREVMAMHCLNHVSKSRECIMKNNAKLKKDPAADARDQGYTRCKVLVVLPCRNSAWKFVKKLASFYPGAVAPKGRLDGMDRFTDEFGPGGKEERVSEKERFMKIGPDHYERFSGNSDDHFRFGIQLHKKYMRIFAPFYSSDVLVVSPIGLRMIVKTQGEKGREIDFLSSVEVLYIDQLDFLLMQNFDHTTTVLEALNLAPMKSRGADFTRIREYILDSNLKFLRQTVIFSQHSTPEGNSIMNRLCFNIRGSVKCAEEHKGSIRQVLPHMQIRQIFHRLADQESLAAVDEARFEFFKDHIYSRISQTSQSHTMIFVSSYIEYVRLRNHFNKIEAEWVGCSEHATVSEVARARSDFFHGRVNLFLITERFHFYYRFKFRGIRHVLFYSIPQFDAFYPELVNLISMGTDTGGTVTVLFSRQDRLALQRLVGTSRAERVLTSDKSTHLFS